MVRKMDNSAIQEQECVSTFSLELKKLLEQADLTQLEFAHKIGVDKNSVNNWVKGRVQPKLYQLKLIIDFFLSNDKTRDFNPLQLFISGSVPNNPNSFEYEKAIRHIQEVYDLQLEEEKLKLENEYREKSGKLQSKYDSILTTNRELSKKNYRLKSRQKDEQEFRRQRHELRLREKTLISRIVKERIFHNIYPESTAKQVLRNPELQDIIKKMYRYEKEHGVTETYREYYNDLIDEIIDTMEEEMTSIIQKIYSPEN